jgi:hypothetical protein
MSAGLLFSQMEPPPELLDEFHHWYDGEHIPVRLAIEGFASAQRFEIDDHPRFLACYYLDDMTALDRPEYLELKRAPGDRSARMLACVTGFTRYISDLISDTGPHDEPVGTLYVVAFAVPEEQVERFESWYQREHVPMLMEADGWLRVRRYRVRTGSDGPEWTHLALHELRDLDVLQSPERHRAITTPQRLELGKEDWMSRRQAWVYRPLTELVRRP